MSQAYLLLRSNKEFGPYTLQELVQQQLQPKDLIWAEGKSAGWQHPSAFDELKEFQQDPIPQNPTPPIEPKAKNVFVRMPDVSMQKGLENVVTAQSSFEDRAEKLRQQAAHFEKEKENKESVTTKHSRSLTDLKNEYANWMEEKKNKKIMGVNKTTASIAAAAVVLLASGFLLSRWLSNGSSTTLLRDAAVTNSMMTPAAQREQVSEDDTPIDAAAAKGIIEKTEGNDQPAEKAEIKTSTLHEKTIHRSVNTEPKVDEAQKVTGVPLAQLIEIKGRTFINTENDGLSKVEVTLVNNSSHTLKVVAVDVFYYNNLKNLLQKRTLYFSNVLPQSSVMLKAPGNESAASVHYKLGLVSSDGGAILYSKE